MERKEEPISPYNGSGHIDLTPYYAVLNIVIKEKKLIKPIKNTKKIMKKRLKSLDSISFIELYRNCDEVTRRR